MSQKIFTPTNEKHLELEFESQRKRMEEELERRDLDMLRDDMKRKEKWKKRLQRRERLVATQLGSSNMGRSQNKRKLYGIFDSDSTDGESSPKTKQAKIEPLTSSTT